VIPLGSAPEGENHTDNPTKFGAEFGCIASICKLSDNRNDGQVGSGLDFTST